MKIAVVTAVYGEYDSPVAPPEQFFPGAEVSWLYVTGEPVDVPAPWVNIVLPSDKRPRLAAKAPKCLPQMFAPNADVTVWVDGSFRFLTPNTLLEIVNQSTGHDLSMIKHPWRDNFYDEAEFSQQMLKYQDEPLMEQAEHYRERGIGENAGLWATGLIVRRKPLNRLGFHWLHEQHRWSIQDQVSLPPMLDELGITPHPLPFLLHGSGIFEWHNHAHEG